MRCAKGELLDMYSSLAALKTLCDYSGWTISNLQANKLLYIAHMLHIAQSPANKPLLLETFEAWDYGPVLPSVYHSAKAFGDKPIRNIYQNQSMVVPATLANKLLKEAAEFNVGKPASKLVAITHWEGGAWAKNYIAGARGQLISNADILEEVKARAA